MCFVNKKGQILIELLVAIAVTAIVVGSVTELLFVSRRAGQDAARRMTQARLAEEAFEAVKAMRDQSWHSIYNLTKETQEYYPKQLASSWALTTNPADRIIIFDEADYERWIIIENMNRNSQGEIVESGGFDDPSTQKVTVTARTEGLEDLVMTRYLTRFRNDVFVQTDWSGGAGQTGPVTAPNNMYFWDDGNVDVTGTPGSIKLKSM